VKQHEFEREPLRPVDNPCTTGWTCTSSALHGRHLQQF
jgi:hypothetical protein